MADIKQLESALVKADAAGNTDDAKALAAEIRRMRAIPEVQKEGGFRAALNAGLDAGLNAIKSKGKAIVDLQGGMIRGAGSIGSTLLAPIDMAKDALDGKGLSLESNRQRRQAITDGLASMGVDTDSMAFGAGKLGTEVAGTAGAGGVIAKGLGVVAPRLASSVASGGFVIGPGGRAIPNMLLRTAGGAIAGGASAGLVNPEDAVTGAVIGGAFPGVVRGANWAGGKIADGLHRSSNRLMQSAIKPTIAELRSGDAATAVQTLLDNGINPNAAGVNKLRSMVDDINTDIAGRIQNSSAMIDKSNVMNALADVRTKFGNQVSPTADLNAIRGVADDFVAHPAYPGSSLPIQAAQELKQGTYRALSKKYGQLGSAEVEAQKGLARGLKDEIAKAIPEISGLNAQESKLITTMKVAERRALMEMNKNPMGLAALAQSPSSWALFMADKSALFKSLAARMLNSSVNAAQAGAPAIERAAANPLIRTAAPLAAANAE